MPDPKLFAVAGNPVFHSRSPHLFNSLFQKLGIEGIYFRMAAVSSREILQTARDMGLSGLNITAPFKAGMIELLDKITEEARIIGAVNTIIALNGGWQGYNTDFIGVVKALKINGQDVKNKRIAVLGAGGAGRAAAFGALREGAERVVLLNRTEKKAAEAADRLGCDYASFEQRGSVLKQSDICISCLATEERILLPEMLEKRLVVFDANYKDSTLLKDADDLGCRTIDGREWLLHQALPAFTLFTGLNPGQDPKTFPSTGLEEPSSTKRNIALIGFMGTGKTTVGKILARRMGFRFVDMDALIEETSGMDIFRIFKEKGEPQFRTWEKHGIRSHVSGSQKTVFSLGGGAVLDAENRKILRKNCRCVWLWSSLGTVMARIEKPARPLLAGKQPERTAQSLLTARIPLYAHTSDIAISTEGGNFQDIAERIQDEMDQAL